MVCAGGFTISLFGMLFFAGFAISSLIVPVLSDKYGRRNIFLWSIFTSWVVLAVLLILPSGYNWIYFIIFLFLITGLQSSGRTSIGYCYFMEIAPERYGSYLGTGWNMSEGMVYIYLTIYFRWISKDWWYTIAFGLVLQTITIVFLIVYSRESPKWLYD